MRTAFRCCFWLLLAGLAVPSIASSQALSTDGGRSIECFALPEAAASEAWVETIRNPVLRTEAEVEEAAAEFLRLRTCLDSHPRTRSLLRLRDYIDLFLTFSGRDVSSDAALRVERVDLALTPDPAVRRLREELGLAPPEGLVFVRYYTDRDRMPPGVQPAFANPQTQAVTILSRYIAVLTPTPRSLSNGRIVDDALQATFSHELVHAFLGARPGVAMSAFPAWFHEGMAIHFSGSGRPHARVDTVWGGRTLVTPTAEYERYERLFLYLEHVLGASSFRSVLARAVEGADASPLVTEAGAASYEELSRRAELWWRWRPLPPGLLSGPSRWWLGGLAVVAALGAVALWRRWQPAVAGSALEVGVNADLIDAVKSGDASTVRHLLRSGAHVDTQDADGRPALAWSVWLNQVEISDALVGAGARVTESMLRLAEASEVDPAIVRLIADALGRQEASGAGPHAVC